MADDPLADMQNLIGYQGLVGPNPYLQYQGKIPMAGFFTGDAGNLPPTDAMGKPIQSFVDYNNNAQADYQKQLAAYNAAAPTGPPGTTLNSAPPAPSGPSGLGPNIDALAQAAAQARAGQQQTPYGGVGTNPAAIAYASGATPQQMAGVFGQMSPTIPGTGGTDARGNPVAPTANPNYSRMIGMMAAGTWPPGGQQAAGPSRGPPPSPPDLRQAYLNALANPGPVEMPGARPGGPGTAPTGPVGSANAMPAFLAANKGSNTPFINTLRQLQGSPA